MVVLCITLILSRWFCFYKLLDITLIGLYSVFSKHPLSSLTLYNPLHMNIEQDTEYFYLPGTR